MSGRRWIALMLAGTLVAACGGGSDGTVARPPDGTEPRCSVDLPDDPAAPVEITFWHAMVTDRHAAMLKDLLARFRQEEPGIRVRAVQQPSYQDTFVKWKASLGGGATPDVVQLEETTVQSALDSRATVPVGACVEADDYDTSDFLPRALDYYSTEGVLRAMPWAVSNPVLFYNRIAFRDAGLDPDDPPATLAEVRAASERIVASGAAKHGIALRVEPFVNEFWYAKDGALYVDHDNGRKGRATASLLDSDTGRRLWTWWNGMVADGLAQNVGAPSTPDHLLAIGNGNAAMAIDASSVLGPILDVLGSGEFPGVEIGAGPLPGLSTGGGVPVGDSALWMSARSTPEQQAAAWRFVRFLSEPGQQSALHVEAGYVPIRRSVVDDPAVQQLWAEQPAFRVGYDQLESGPRGAATSGSVIGDYQGVRDAVRDALTAMLDGKLSPDRALERAQRDADAAIEAYNRRVGA